MAPGAVPCWQAPKQPVRTVHAAPARQTGALLHAHASVGWRPPRSDGSRRLRQLIHVGGTPAPQRAAGLHAAQPRCTGQAGAGHAGAARTGAGHLRQQAGGRLSPLLQQLAGSQSVRAALNQGPLSTSPGDCTGNDHRQAEGNGQASAPAPAAVPGVPEGTAVQTTLAGPHQPLPALRKRSRLKKRSSELAGARASLPTPPGPSRALAAPADAPSVPSNGSSNSKGAGSDEYLLEPVASPARLPEPEPDRRWNPYKHLDNDPQDICVLPKPIFIVSDCTGESAARTVRAAFGQFEHQCNQSVPANLFIFRFLSEEAKAYEICARAAEEDALVVFTVVDRRLVAALASACKLHQVRYVDLWSNLLEVMEEHLDAVRSGLPLTSPARATRPPRGLAPDYYAMIEAVEYTRKMDDGACPALWGEADLLLLGVSRSGKTPLAIYLGQRGYKVANLPLVPGIPPPPELFQIPQSKIVALTIDAAVLCNIRKNRLGQMGLAGEQADYNDLRKVRAELEAAHALYAAHPEWPVIDVTLRGVEETAALILQLQGSRHGGQHPVWGHGGTPAAPL